MIVLENGDVLEGDAASASEVDFTIHGLDNSALKQLADGQLADSKGTIFTADSTDVVSSIILVNTGAAANAVNLYLKPSGGTSRRLIPKDMLLAAGYSLHFSGDKITVLSSAGNVVTAFPSLTSAQLAALVTDETGSGALVFANSPTLVTPALGTPASGDLQNCTTANTTTKGVVEHATAAEINTGTDAERVISPDTLAGSEAGKRCVEITVFDPTTDLATGDGKAYFVVPTELNGMNLVRVAATVITAGTTNSTTIQIANVTDACDMLSTLMAIETTETSTRTSAQPGVIDTAHDDVATGDVLRIDIDAASTTKPKGLIVEMIFQLP